MQASKDMTQQPHLFCFGLGYTAKALAGALLERGWRVTGTFRDASHAAAARRPGLEVVIFDRAHPVAEIDRHLAGATHLLSSVPPDEHGDPVLDVHGVAITEAAT